MSIEASSSLVRGLGVLLADYEHLKGHVEDARRHLEREIEDPEALHPAEYDLGAVAFVIGNVYVGAERLFVRIAKEIDDHLPRGEAWHRQLLAQMTEHRVARRPAVLSVDTAAQLGKYLSLRHVQRNVYVFHLQWPRMVPLLLDAPPTIDAVVADVRVFIAMIEQLSAADE